MNNITITTPQGIEIIVSHIAAWEKTEAKRGQFGATYGVDGLRIYTTGQAIDVECTIEEANELIEQIKRC
jgi:hypothetical protein